MTNATLHSVAQVIREAAQESLALYFAPLRHIVRISKLVLAPIKSLASYDNFLPTSEALFVCWDSYVFAFRLADKLVFVYRGERNDIVVLVLRLKEVHFDYLARHPELYKRPGDLLSTLGKLASFNRWKSLPAKLLDTVENSRLLRLIYLEILARRVRRSIGEKEAAPNPVGRADS